MGMILDLSGRCESAAGDRQVGQPTQPRVLTHPHTHQYIVVQYYT
jgi:hypothetical protein